MPLNLTGENFESEVIKSQKPVLVDFWAEWCPPCLMVAPILEKLSEEYKDKVKICKLNVDEAPEVANRFSVSSIPTLILFKGGKEAGRQIGALPEETLKKWIDSGLE